MSDTVYCWRCHRRMGNFHVMASGEVLCLGCLKAEIYRLRGAMRRIKRDAHATIEGGSLAGEVTETHYASCIRGVERMAAQGLKKRYEKE